MAKKQKFQVEKLSFEDKTELEHRTCDAIILAFDKPIKYDYFIPRPEIIKTVTVLAVSRVCGISPKFDKSDFHYHPELGLDYLEDERKISKKILEGLRTIFFAQRDEACYLERYLHYDNLFGKEWFHGHGTLFRFRPDEKENAEQAYKKYWNENERKHFELLYPLMQKFIQSK